ncbi:MAG: FimB/Mfa2 family fimbrial subunit [Phocaeicola sp.]|uniref:FimB/Mfa2 family fimbrial subunit n=1 Tax=Phocaeicola sp. TaxID=2773926 RepID=UPI0023C85386|nr:FimB/Mfa2 family fimbrial subunit [Phocaeicola sp.]MDE5677027.1 FimB/Mfa2 family fimbrial subunit [Phocaeicola sp.]MDE6181072.1 FimB/Mfa2 family fimbrial subunit [Phocaeicola sp.]
MKNKSIYIKIFLVLFVLSTAACQHIYDEEEEEVTQTTLPLKVSARSSGESRINYPAYVYAFSEDGSCAAVQKITDDAQIEMKLPSARYTLVAIAGMGEEYIIPEHPTLDDVIVMKKGNRSMRALMMGTSMVTVGSKKNISVSITLYYAVSLVNVTLKDIPADVEKVSLRMSPLYSSLSFTREYSGKDSDTEISCTPQAGGIWSAAPFYVFPGSGSQTVFSVTLEDKNQTKTFGYTFKGKPEANVPLNIGGSYSGNITVGGSLISEDWKEPVEVKFSFGDSEEGGGTENPPVDPDLSGLPEIGSIWNEGIVAGIENATSKGADILLMSLSEWTSLAANVGKTIKDEETAGWHLPDEAEAQTLHSAFKGASLDKLNEVIQGLNNGDPLLDIEKRYIYDRNGIMYAFGFKTTSKFLQAGSTIKYKIRLVRRVHCNLTD